MSDNEYGIKFSHNVGAKAWFLVERTPRGLSWQLVHADMNKASDSDNVNDVAYHGLRDAAATLRRWAAELGHVADEMMTPELDESQEIGG